VLELETTTTCQFRRIKEHTLLLLRSLGPTQRLRKPDLWQLLPPSLGGAVKDCDLLLSNAAKLRV
jgi:hypothetical protein